MGGWSALLKLVRMTTTTPVLMWFRGKQGLLFRPWWRQEKGLNLKSPPAGDGQLWTHPWAVLWERVLCALSLSLFGRICTGMSRTWGRAEWRGSKVSGPWKRCAQDIRTICSRRLPCWVSCGQASASEDRRSGNSRFKEVSGDSENKRS